MNSDGSAAPVTIGQHVVVGSVSVSVPRTATM